MKNRLITNLNYIMENRQITRRVCLLLMTLCSFTVVFAQIAISGRVMDESKEPIIGANIKVKGGTTGTISDMDGRFKLSVPKSSSVLVISFIGYATKEVTVGNQKVLNVTLKEDGVALDEVVAVGYATVKKSDLTGSVAKVDMNDLTKAQVLSIDQALGGRVAGVQVVSSDGQPGAEANIVIRGSNTISDSSDGAPLYVIDGFATEDGNLASLNSNDIESIDVLKDASATAIYGARGANGVIIITTKRGSESAPKVTYDGYVTYQLKPQGMELLQGRDYVAMQEEVLTVSEMNRTYYSYDETLGRNRILSDYDKVPSYNWQDQVFRNAPMTSHHISLTGGTKNTKYSSSLSYYNQQGIIINSSYESLKARLTLDQQITKKVKFGGSLNFANNISKGTAPSRGSDAGGTQYFLYQVLAYRPVFYADSEESEDALLAENPNYPYNPLKTIENMYQKVRSRQLNLNAYLSWDILKDLAFKATFAYTWRQDRNEAFNNADTYWGDPRYSAKHSNGNFSFREWDGWSNEYTLTYKKRVKSHNITAMLGASMNSKTISTLGASSTMVPWDGLGFWGISNGTPDKVTSTNFEDRMMSYFARFNYDWKSRYLMTATMRADGSSRFPYHKWGYFPSASFGWRVSEEAFMQGSRKWLSNLKFRVGWGTTGNNNTKNYYPSQLLYLGDQNYAFNNSIDNPAIYISQMPNKDLKWETTYQTNIGLDFGLFNNRINGVVDIYDKQTKDLLLYAEVPLSIGFDKIQQNIGSVRNRGLEISINTVNLVGGRGRFKWTTNFNISFNRNEITGLSGDQDYQVSGLDSPKLSNLYIARIGHPLSEMFGYVYDGVYQYEDFNEVSPNVFVLKDGIPNNTKERNTIQPGDMKLKDINGDGKVTPEDMTVIGHGLPVHTGGFTNNFEYKGFDLSVFFQWSYGNDVINYNRAKLENMNGVRHTNMLASAKDHWTPRIDNGDGTYAAGNYTNYLWRVDGGLSDINTSRVVEDASFLRLKNVQLGYNFPVKLIRKFKLSSLRLYLSGQNLWTWTKYTGYDPEVSTRNSAMTRGFDYSAYPRTTSFTFGVKLGL